MEQLLGKKTMGLVAGAVMATGGVGAADTIQNPYIDRGEFRELPIQAQVENAGEHKVRIAKDRPEATFEKWGGEVAMRVSVPSVEGSANRALMSSRLTYGEGDTQVQMRQVENGYKVDFVLNSKPTSNEFTMQIDNAENLDFFYQPELTKEEIEQGAIRPENVVGSYAVYHKTKKNHRVGDLNYATGKAYHIYRPKVIDDAGNEVWGELDYNNGELAVTVPQSFLSKAVYPVVVDPTFGYTSTGESSDNVTDRLFGSVFSLSENGEVSQISAWFGTSAFPAQNNPMVAGIYNNSQNKEFQSSEIFLDEGSIFHDFPVSPAQSLSAADYWILSNPDSGDSGASAVARYDTGTTNQGNDEPLSYNSTMPASFTGSFVDRKYSIYATYTVSEEATPPTQHIKSGTVHIKSGNVKME